MKISWFTKIIDVREKSLTVGGKKGSDGTTELFKESAGWWITFNDGLSIYVGDARPAFEAGDSVKLTLQHIRENSSDASEETKS